MSTCYYYFNLPMLILTFIIILIIISMLIFSLGKNNLFMKENIHPIILQSTDYLKISYKHTKLNLLL